jgi:hypothetical protein
MEENNNGIKVMILKSDNVMMDEIDNVKIIRIKDNKYNLLIMKDYWPVVGEINGSIYIEADTNYDYNNIKGFYSLTHNLFHLIIQEEGINEEGVNEEGINNDK